MVLTNLYYFQTDEKEKEKKEKLKEKKTGGKGEDKEKKEKKVRKLVIYQKVPLAPPPLFSRDKV